MVPQGLMYTRMFESLKNTLFLLPPNAQNEQIFMGANTTSLHFG